MEEGISTFIPKKALAYIYMKSDPHFTVTSSPNFTIFLRTKIQLVRYALTFLMLAWFTSHL